MPVFFFKEAGTGRSGMVRAGDRTRASNFLRGTNVDNARLWQIPGFAVPVLDVLADSRPPLSETARFCRQLELLYTSGVPLAESLTRLAVEGWSPPLFLGVKRAERALHNGYTLSESLRVAGFLSGTCLTLIEAGERSGKLGETLGRCAEILEADSDNVQRVRSALVYPCFTMSVFFLAFFLLFVFVLPKFADIFDGLHAQIPLPVKLGLELAAFLGDPLIVLAIVETLLLGSLLLRLYLRTEKGRSHAYLLACSIPPVGHFLSQSYYANMSFTLSTLIGSGISVTETLSLCAKDCPQPALRASLLSAVEQVEHGMSLAEALETEELPALFCQFVRIGEETGHFDESLGFLRQLYSEETQGAVDRFLALLEPVLIIVMGLSVGAFLLGALLPLVSLLSNLGDA